MRDYSPLVRFSNDGTEFHVLWAVRSAMRMLKPGSDLVGVAIEGEGPAQTKGSAHGLLAIDLVEYFGGLSLADADRVVVRQMKYSTTAPNRPWAASDLAETIKSFAARYLDAVAEVGEERATEVLRFSFVTNRPISKNVLQALQAARRGEIPAAPAPLAQAYASAFGPTGLGGGELAVFVTLLRLEGGQGRLAAQEAQAAATIRSYLPIHDHDVLTRMKELVRDKMLSKSAEDNVIDPQSLLNCFQVSGVEELLPAEAKFESAKGVVEREQYALLAASIVAKNQHAVVEAEGGVGKSVLAQRLPSLMPQGSAAVVFDGFAGGDYRNPRLARHRHAVGLVHLVNDLALKGLCDPLVPIAAASPQDFLRSWRSRVQQAVAGLRSIEPTALLLVVIDAGDSLGIAADEQGETSFVPALLQDTAVDGCRLVVTARPERVEQYLKPTAKVGRYALTSFTATESAEHLRSKFPAATESEVADFHDLTSQNPRVQTNALQAGSTLGELLARLAGVATDVDGLIARQMESAFAEVVEQQAGDRAAPERLRVALGILSPPMPVGAIAAAAVVSEAAVSSFVSDLAGGRALLVRDSSVQFRDEPTETWFKDRTGRPPVDFAALADALKDLASQDFYAASELPRLLFKAKRYEDLTLLALQAEAEEHDDPLRWRAILHQRVKFALKGALAEGRTGDAIRLLLRSGEELAGIDRRDDFLLQQPFLATVFTAREHIHDFVFRKKPWRQGGKAYVACAALLVGAHSTESESRKFLSLAKGWLDGALRRRKDAEWSNEPEDNYELSDFAMLAQSWLMLEGTQGCLEFLEQWREWVVFLVTRELTANLLNRGEHDRCHELWGASSTRRAVRMAVATELAAVCRVPLDGMDTLVDGLIAEPLNFEDFEFYQRDGVELSCVAVCEAAARAGVAPGRIRKLLETLPRRLTSNSWLGNRTQRHTVLRAATLWAALGQTSSKLSDIWDGGPGKGDGRPAPGPSDEYMRLVGAALPWFQLRADVICHHDSSVEDILEAAKEDVATRTESYGASGWDEAVGEDIAWAGMEALCWSSTADVSASKNLCNWFDAKGLILRSHTWAALARMLAHRSEAWHDVMLFCAGRGATLINLQRLTAEITAEGLREIAAAVCARDRDEARAYFEAALARLGDIGDAELHDRLGALLALAIGASGNVPDNRLAYRLSRAAEVLCAHNSHKFPWGDVAVAIAALSPGMAVACASRWHDGGIASRTSVLSHLLPHLVEKGWLSPASSIALRPLSDGWIRDEVAELQHAPPETRQRLWDVLLRDLCLSSGQRVRQLGHLEALGKRYDLNLGELPALKRSWLSAPPKSVGNRRKWKRPRRRTIKAWARILGAVALTTPDLVSAAIARYEEELDRGEVDVLFREMRATVPVAQRVKHVMALASCEGLDVRDISDALEAAFKEWSSSESVRAVKSKVAETLIRSRMTEIATTSAWQIVRIAAWCERIAGWERPAVIRRISKGLADASDQMSAGSLFYFAGLLGSEIEVREDALKGLTYGLERLERSIQSTDGDGEWRPELDITGDSDTAIAMLLYATLGSPEAETRWQAAHVVRRLSAAGETGKVRALGLCLTLDTLPAFTDRRFVFYALNAQLYALVALARAAKDHPNVVASCEVPLTRVLSGDHVLNRQFAAMGLLALEESKGAASNSSLVAALSTVNRPAQASVRAAWRAGRAKERSERKGAAGFDLEFQVAEYWCAALSRCFGVSSLEVQRRAEKIAEERWAAVGLGEWTSDMRQQAGVYRGDTYAGHGTPPASESLAFYLSMHAVLCVAGQLLSERPPVVLYDDQEEDEWQSWLQAHLLAIPDGRWLSDCRERAPLEVPSWFREPERWERRDRWASSVAAVDIDEAIGFGGVLEGTHLVIAGSWRQRSGGRSQAIQVASALVSRSDSMALMRAMQTATFPYSFFLPHGREGSIRVGGLRLRGWVSMPRRRSGLDSRDPLAGSAEWPSYALSAPVERKMRIVTTEPERRWSSQNGSIRLRIWGDDNDSDIEEPTTSGQRLSADLAFFRDVLASLNADVIFQVRVRRTHAHHKQSERLFGNHDDYTRIYLLRSGLEFHTLHECRRLGPKTRRSPQ